MLSKLNVRSSLERSSALEEIQRDCAAAGKCGKGDFKHTAGQKSGNNSVFTSITSSRWAKPIGYTALALAAVGTAHLAYSYCPSGTGVDLSGSVEQKPGGSTGGANKADDLLREGEGTCLDQKDGGYMSELLRNKTVVKVSVIAVAAIVSLYSGSALLNRVVQDVSVLS